MVVVVLVGEFEHRFACASAQPHDGAANEFVGPFARCHLPGVADARESRCGLKVGDNLGGGVHLQERRRHLVGDLSLDGLEQRRRTVLSPCHCDHMFCCKQVADAQCDSGDGRYVAGVGLGHAGARVAAQQHEAALRRHGRPGLVVGQRTVLGEFADDQIQSTKVVDERLVGLAVCMDILLGGLGAKGVDVVRFDIDLVE